MSEFNQFLVGVFEGAFVASQFLVGAFGILIAGLAIWGIVVPRRLIDFVKGAMARPWGLRVAVGVRFLLGFALLIAASASMFPTTFRVLGWIAIAAAIALPVLGRKFINSLLGSVEAWPLLAIRAWLLLGTAFGGFLVHAVR